MFVCVWVGYRWLKKIVKGATEEAVAERQWNAKSH